LAFIHIIDWIISCSIIIIYKSWKTQKEWYVKLGGKVIQEITPHTYNFMGTKDRVKRDRLLTRYLHGACAFLNWNAYNINSHLTWYILENVSIGAISTIILEYNIVDISIDSKTWYYYSLFDICYESRCFDYLVWIIKNTSIWQKVNIIIHFLIFAMNYQCFDYLVWIIKNTSVWHKVAVTKTLNHYVNINSHLT